LLARSELAKLHGPSINQATVPTWSRMSRDDLEIVRSDPLFDGLSTEEIVNLLREAVVRRYRRGATLFVQGECASAFFLVLDGWVRLSRLTPEGGEVTLGLFSQGESLAEALLQHPECYAMTGQTAEASRLLALPAASFRRRLESHVGLCRNMMLLMAHRLSVVQQQLEQVSSRSTVQRVALFLVRLCRCRQGPCLVELPLDKTFIAARLGMQPETLSRAFAKLRPHGVEVNGDRVRIEEVARLHALVHGKHG
jgi:CRP-like cAMP-binding protein